MGRNRDIVIKLDLGFVPDAAVSEAVLVQTESSTFLTFRAVKPDSDGQYQDAGTALVEFLRCRITKFGYPNDEALPGHPLYPGMHTFYDTFEVLNSSWAAELAEQNRVAFPDWTLSPVRHFIITFHDSTFECLAWDLKAEVLDEPYASTFERIKKRALVE